MEFFDLFENTESKRKAARSKCKEPASVEQAEAGTYAKGHFSWNGLGITIETPKDGVRRGKSKDGKEWSCKMHSDYGYVKKTESEADGDHIDVFVGPNLNSEIIYVVDQDGNGNHRFDEHKCMIGFDTKEDARKGYLKNYEKGWKGDWEVVPLTIDQFKWWLFHGDTGKPLHKQKVVNLKEKHVFSLEAILESDDGWIGVDLDGTLAHGGEWKGEEHVGKPIPEMVEKVKKKIDSGKTVKIFTARAADLSDKGKKAIEDFCKEHLGKVLDITNEKDPNMIELWDDRAKQVEKNKGEFVESEKRGLPKPKNMEGVSLGEDEDGFFVYTHRARSNSYKSAEAIPQSVIDDIESTG